MDKRDEDGVPNTVKVAKIAVEVLVHFSCGDCENRKIECKNCNGSGKVLMTPHARPLALDESCYTGECQKCDDVGSVQLEFNYTPGPWFINDDNIFVSTKEKGDIDSINNTYILIATANDTAWPHGLKPKDSLANAKLIAAAPDLLDALTELSDLMDEFNPLDKEPACGSIADKVRSAIAKATV